VWSVSRTGYFIFWERPNGTSEWDAGYDPEPVLALRLLTGSFSLEQIRAQIFRRAKHHLVTTFTELRILAYVRIHNQNAYFNSQLSFRQEMSVGGYVINWSTSVLKEDCFSAIIIAFLL
jgi:hypothetical protein